MELSLFWKIYFDCSIRKNSILSLANKIPQKCVLILLPIPTAVAIWNNAHL
jgi:hypothetical protein